MKAYAIRSEKEAGFFHPYHDDRHSSWEIFNTPYLYESIEEAREDFKEIFTTVTFNSRIVEVKMEIYDYVEGH